MRNRDKCDVDGMRQVYPVWLYSATQRDTARHSATATCNGGIGPGRVRKDATGASRERWLTNDG